jgi:glycine/D-amino acid oxidase-like deaminating enzyme
VNQPEETGQLPETTDVVIVGAGITGLSAARTLLAAGKDVVLVDKEHAGFGASTRNAGLLSKAHRDRFSTLIGRFGMKLALALMREAKTSYEFTLGVIEEDQIQCDLDRGGRVYWAYTTKQLKELQREHDLLRKHESSLGITPEIVERKDVGSELASDFYCGGMRVAQSSSLNPAKYVQGLIDRIRRQGAIVANRTHVQRIASRGNGFLLHTSRGSIRADKVIIATNGYCGREVPYLQRRVIPCFAQMISVKPRNQELLGQLSRSRRAHLDIRPVFRYLRVSPDGTHVLLGSRTGMLRPGARNPKLAARLLMDYLVEVLPDLEHCQPSHYWSGLLGLTLDQIPHIGITNGLHYAVGMNAHGLVQGTYLGDQIARCIIEDKHPDHLFEKLPFRAIPFFRGRPWFLPLITTKQRVMHRLERPPR